MTLVVEDGTGVSGADSYNAIAELDAYMTRMGYADWPVPENPTSEPEQPENEPELPEASDEQETPEPVALEEPELDDPNLAQKEAAARRAALYIDTKYALRFSGTPVSPDQGLAWPRANAFDYYGRGLASDSVPLPIKNAHAEVARLVYIGTQLTPQTTAGPLLKRKKIDVLEWEYDVDSYTNAPVFGWVDQLLLSLLGPAEEVGALGVLAVERA